MRSCLALLLLAGCPPPAQYLTADVMSAHTPVEDALVAVDCGHAGNAAYRTDADGRARVSLRSDAGGPGCVVTVAKPGFRTIESPTPALCTTRSGCPPIAIPLDEVPQ